MKETQETKQTKSKFSIFIYTESTDRYDFDVEASTLYEFIIEVFDNCRDFTYAETFSISKNEASDVDVNKLTIDIWEIINELRSSIGESILWTETEELSNILKDTCRTEDYSFI